ncbi:MAG: copper resistance CopC family protein [Rhodospirillaceae bacterium]
MATKCLNGRIFGGAVVWLCLTVTGLAGRAEAHAVIVSAAPAAGTVVIGPDVDIALHFNSRLDHKRSRLNLTGANGVPVPLLIIAPAIDPTTITSRGNGLGPGTYSLHWQVLAVDGHMTRGVIPFTVAVP